MYLKYIFLLSLLLATSIKTGAQISVLQNNCESYNSHTLDYMPPLYSLYCLELPHAQSPSHLIYYTFGTEKEILATSHFEFNETMELTPEPGGSLYAHIEPGLEVVAYVEDLNNVAKLSKFELGIKPPDTVLSSIQNFLNETGNNELNPYMSDDVYIEAVFKKMEYDTVIYYDPPNHPEEVYYVDSILVKRDGFFTKEVERDISGFEGLYTHPSANTSGNITEGYETLGGNWTVTDSDYPFRVRFAPPMVGEWFCKIKISIQGGQQVYYSPEFSFNVINSNKKGYLKVDNNNRFLKRNGETFRPIGINYPWPIRSGYPLISGVNGNKLVDPPQYYGETAPIAHYEQYLRMMDTLAMNGINYFRMIMNPWSLDIEYEKLGNYTDRMHIAKEMDLILERAEQNDMLIHWNFMLHNTLQVNGFNIRNWDWSDEAYPLDTSSTSTPGYCYKTQLADVETPLDFLTSENAKKYYKERLRYIVARWGYSPDIAMFEHFSEINQIGTRYEYTDDAHPIEGTNQYTGNEIKFAEWHDEMSKYLKNDLGIQQLLTLSYTTALRDPFADGGQDYSFSIPEIDIINWNNYNFGGDDPFFDLDRWHKKGNQRPIDDLKNGEKGSGNTSTGRGEYLKPMFYSEHGAVRLWGCDENEVETVRSIWKSFFTGTAGALEWEGEKSKTLHTYQNVRDFIEGVDLEGGEWHSGITELQSDGEWLYSSSFAEDCIRDDESADLIYLRSGDKKKAFGVITNRTYNYHTKGGCSDLEFQPTTPFIHSFGASSPSSNNNRLRLRNMELGEYTIKYYKYNNPSVLLNVESGSGAKVTLNYPTLNEDNWIVLFTAHRSNIPFKNNIDVNDSIGKILNNPKLEQSKINIYPNPNEGTFTVESNLEKINNIKCYSSIGKIVFEDLNINTQNYRINNLSSGIYFIEVLTENSTVRKKIVVRND